MTIMTLPIRHSVPRSIKIIFLLISWMLFVFNNEFVSLLGVVNNTALPAHQLSQMNFGIVLFAYGTAEDLSMKYLGEAHELCHQLQLKHIHQSYDLGLSLFTMKHHYTKYIHNVNYSSVGDCVFDKVIFLEQLAIHKYDTQNKEWSTRIELLSHSPYYLTMSLDTDFYPCYAFNFTHLYTQMETNDIDFAYTSFRTQNGKTHPSIKFPQGGLFLYRKNNKTKYLFDEWLTYHTVHNYTDDQGSLYHTLQRILPLRIMNVYMLNNRYNFRGFAVGNIQYQLLYPTNKIIMFHRRINYAIATGTQRPDLICQMLNKYPNDLSILYLNKSTKHVHHCFSDSDTKCLYHASREKLFISRSKMRHKYVFSDEYHCQWNENIDFVPYDQDMCH
eukprot:59006_1